MDEVSYQCPVCSNEMTESYPMLDENYNHCGIVYKCSSCGAELAISEKNTQAQIQNE